MIRTISPQDMREMERAFLEGTGYPSILLMEHAAQAVVDALLAYAPREGRVLFVCGSGNNGGDGCAAARLWMQHGGQADVWLLKSPSQMKGDAGVNGCLLNSCGAPLNVLYSEAPEVPGDCAAIVDALYGTGLSRELDGAALSAVRRINESGLPVVSVDIPSGVDGATGDPWAWWTGTSFAAPQITGAIARLAAEQGITARQAADRLDEFGKPVPGYGKAMQILEGIG